MSEARAQSHPTFSEALWALVERELSGGRLVLDEIAHLFSKEVGATASVVCLTDPAARRTDVVGAWSADGYLERQLEWFAMNGVLGDVVARQRTTMTVDGTQLWRFDGDQLNVTEGWVAPVFGDGQYGVVCMLFDRQTLDVERMTATARELGPLLPRISSARDG